MAETKFLDNAGLTHLFEKINAKFSKLGHKHTKADITDFAHSHNDLYYGKTEVDSKLSGKSNTSHNHDDRYYTESEINSKLSGKSDTSHSHSTHLTTEIAASTDLNTVTTAGWYKCSASATAAGLKNCPTQIAFAMEVLLNAGVTQKLYEYDSSVPKVYIRNCYDNAWGEWKRVYTTADKPTAGEIGAAASSHTHTKAQITDFPTSMPASDVYSWAKQSSKPSYSASEVGAVPTSRTVNGKALSSDISLSAGDVGAAPSSHSHNYAGSSSAGGSANWANGADYANYAFSNNGVSTSGDGSAYTATISDFSLATGKSIVIIPNVTSTTTTPTLNVSGTGAKNIRMRLSSSTSSTIPLINSNFLTQYKPVKVTYDGTYWVIDDFIQPDANRLYGTLISSGSSAPSSGTAGFIYIQTT